MLNMKLSEDNTKDKVLQALKSMYNDSVKIDFCGILDEKNRKKSN